MIVRKIVGVGSTLDRGMTPWYNSSMRRSDVTSTYQIPIQCSNCNYNGTADIVKGELVPSAILCPNCGCETAKKREPPILPIIKPAKPWYPYHTRPWIPWTTDVKRDDNIYKRNPGDGPLPEIRMNDTPVIH